MNFIYSCITKSDISLIFSVIAIIMTIVNFLYKIFKDKMDERLSLKIECKYTFSHPELATFYNVRIVNNCKRNIRIKKIRLKSGKEVIRPVMHYNKYDHKLEPMDVLDWQKHKTKKFYNKIIVVVTDYNDNVYKSKVHKFKIDEMVIGE